MSHCCVLDIATQLSWVFYSDHCHIGFVEGAVYWAVQFMGSSTSGVMMSGAVQALGL